MEWDTSTTPNNPEEQPAKATPVASDDADTAPTEAIGDTEPAAEEPAILLTEVEARVLGCLMEKAKTTPDIYPLTLNSLVHACNQKTSRDPVMELDEDAVMDALDALRNKALVMRVDTAGSRTAKFRENLTQAWDLSREEYALLAVLLLRGPQTGGQLRTRTERLHPFTSVPEVLDWLKKMQNRDEELYQLVQNLGRPPGSKEIRYGHVLCGKQDVGTIAEAASEKIVRPLSPSSQKIEELEKTVNALQERVARLEEILQDLA